MTDTLFAGLQYPAHDGSITRLSAAESQAIYTALRSAGMVENDGKVNERLRAALADGSLPLPTTLTEAAAKAVRVLAQILIQSGRLIEAATSPTAFMDAATVALKSAKQKVLAEGVQYRRLDGELWGQELFQAEDGLDPDRLLEVSKSPLTHIVYDSETIEKQMALDMDKSAAIKVFAKLPKAFKIPTPLGEYNPDWAIVREDGDERIVYLVCETKGDLNNLRDEERGRISCGRAHFKELEVPFVTATGIDGVLSATCVDAPGFAR